MFILSKLMRLVVIRKSELVFLSAVCKFSFASRLNDSLESISSSGALISVIGVRKSCAVLIKKRTFSSDNLRCFFKDKKCMIIAHPDMNSSMYSPTAHQLNHIGFSIIISMERSSSINPLSSLEIALTRNL